LRVGAGVGTDEEEHTYDDAEEKHRSDHAHNDAGH